MANRTTTPMMIHFFETVFMCVCFFAKVVFCLKDYHAVVELHNLVLLRKAFKVTSKNRLKLLPAIIVIPTYKYSLFPVVSVLKDHANIYPADIQGFFIMMNKFNTHVFRFE